MSTLRTHTDQTALLGSKAGFGLWFSRIFVGVLFIFSGLIKANDPMGFGYKLTEYFEVFHTTFLNNYATAIAVLLCTLEIILGALLLLGFWSKKVAWGLLLLIIFFTFLTFYSAFFKVVTSCGCFGDAIPLTPWQSFSKDLVLLILILVIFVNRSKIRSVVESASLQKALSAVVVLFSLIFGLYTVNYLPVIDFLPYKVGADLPSLMKAPEGAPVDEYQIIYNMKNKKTGETKKLTDKEYIKTEIWKDTSWEIVGQPDKKLVKKGYDIKIKDLIINDATGTEYTHELIGNPYYNLIIVAYDLNRTNVREIAELNALALNAAENFNIRTVLLTANSAQDADKFSKQNRLVTEIFFADAIPLKSMVRANPGILLLKNGVIINKWHYNNMPKYEYLVEHYFSK